MAARRMQSKMAIHSKLHLLRTLTNSKSVKKNSIILDALIYIIKLRLQLEAIEREYQQLLNHVQEVKAFEEMKLSVVQARVTSRYFFGMEAIVEVENEVNLDVQVLTRSLQMAIQKQSVEIDK
ncbi:hypothetical protein HAX54_021677 [Datura stramonium]|uniref:Plant bHLH transcription factor ACT-like domain-containing protein n=1 Tax=Datura stramonium TaxID=4076 RepID=A0ABS8RKB9_DATST|nr:hypothetical protein [Datura stramonium]